MTRICTKCYRRWVSLSSEVTEILDQCPTCRAGMEPLSTLRAEPKGKRPKPEPLEEQP